MKRSFTKKLLDKIGIVLLGALVAPIITVLYLALQFNQIRTYFYFKKALKKAKRKHQI